MPPIFYKLEHIVTGINEQKYFYSQKTHKHKTDPINVYVKFILHFKSINNFFLAEGYLFYEYTKLIFAIDTPSLSLSDLIVRTLSLD